MLHTDIIEIYKQKYPTKAKNIDVWHANGFNSIRIRLKNKEEIIFSHDAKDDKWKIESLNSFYEKLKGLNKK